MCKSDCVFANLQFSMVFEWLLKFVCLFVCLFGNRQKKHVYESTLIDS